MALCLAGSASAANIPVSGNIAVSTTWTADNVYNLVGQVYVLPGATLTIQAGTVVKSNPVDLGSLAVTRGAKIFVNGTQTNPVIMTSTSDTMTAWHEGANEWGNLTIMGKGLISASHYSGLPVGSNTKFPSGLNVKQMEGLVAAIPGDPNVMYGGNNDNDDSGSIHFLSLRYGGKVVGLGNELNGLSLGAIGRDTDIDHVEIMNNVDDGIELWGGTVNLKNIAIWNIGDDSFDVDEGWRGKLQFFLGVQGYSVNAAQGSGVGDNVFEMDGAEDSDAQPVTTAVVYNATVIGQPIHGDQGLALRDNARVQFRNSIFTDIGEQVVKNDNVDGDGGSGYGYNGTLTFASIWATPASASLDLATTVNGCDDAAPSVCAAGVNFPADLYKSQVDGNLAEVKDTVFYNNLFASGYTTLDTLGVRATGNNVTATLSPIVSITRAAPVVKGGLTMLQVTGLDPRAANDAVTSVGMAPADGFFTPAKFRGAFSKDVNWLLGWTASDAYGFHAGQVNPANPVTDSALSVTNSFPTEVNKTYTLEESVDMMNWKPIAAVIGDGSVHSWTDTVAMDVAKFYRVIVQ